MNAVGMVEPRTPPPDFQIEGLWSALGRLDRMLERATTAADAAAGTGAAEPYRGLYITSEDVKRLVRRTPGEPLLAGAEAEAAIAMPSGSRFPWLQQTFSLEPIDADIVLIALAPETDLRYERLFAYLHDDVTRRRPSVDLALNLLCASREAKIVARGRFSPDAPLIRQRVLHLTPEAAATPLLSHGLRLDDAIVRFLLGQTGLDARLQSIARFEPAAATDRALAGPADDAMARAIGAGSIPHFYLEGTASGEKAAAAARLAGRLRSPVLTADLSRAAASGDVETTLDALFREAQLLDAVLFLDDMDAVSTPDRDSVGIALQAHLERSTGVVVGAGDRACAARFKTMTTIPIAEPGFHERRAIWSSALAEHGIAADGPHVDELASRYRLNDIEIRSAVRNTLQQAALRGAAPDPSDLARSSRQQVRRNPGTLARKLTPFYDWDDLVLPGDQIAQLRELCHQARHRHVVYGDWGFDRKLSLGKGLSALFSGPPGTGKTMAVEVIANDLGLDLYKIDLSQVVSKYIGETEKNMDRLFTEARAGNAILFFDECDALFGKRTDRAGRARPLRQHRDRISAPEARRARRPQHPRLESPAEPRRRLHPPADVHHRVPVSR